MSTGKAMSKWRARQTDSQHGAAGSDCRLDQRELIKLGLGKRSAGLATRTATIQGKLETMSAVDFSI